MAAGLGFKTFNTGEVLTAADTNGYLMQGILVFATEAARDAAITVPAEGQFAFTKDNNSTWFYDGAAWVLSGATGDITAVTAGTGISGGGASGDVTVTNSMATAIDAKGDLVAGTADNAFSRIAIGANDTVLTADSAEATGMKWAAAGATTQNFTLLSDATPSGSTYTVSGLSGYDEFMCVFETIKGITATNWRLEIRLNGDSASNYGNYTARYSGLSSYSTNNPSSSAGATNNTINLAQTSTNLDSTISGYLSIKGANSSGKKIMQSATAGTSGGADSQSMIIGAAVYNSASTISSISFLSGSATFSTGNIKIYGAA